MGTTRVRPRGAIPDPTRNRERLRKQLDTPLPVRWRAANAAVPGVAALTRHAEAFLESSMASEVARILADARRELTGIRRGDNDEDIDAVVRAIERFADLFEHGMREDPHRRGTKAARTREEWLDVDYGSYNASVYALLPGDDWGEAELAQFHLVAGHLNLRFGKSHMLEHARDQFQAAFELLPPTEVEDRVKACARGLQASFYAAEGPGLFDRMDGCLSWAVEARTGCTDSTRQELEITYADALAIDVAPTQYGFFGQPPTVHPTPEERRALERAFDRGFPMLHRLCAHADSLPHRRHVGWHAVGVAALLFPDHASLPAFLALAEVTTASDLVRVAVERSLSLDDGRFHPYGEWMSATASQRHTREILEKLSARA